MIFSEGDIVNAIDDKRLQENWDLSSLKQAVVKEVGPTLVYIKILEGHIMLNSEKITQGRSIWIGSYRLKLVESDSYDIF